MQKTPVTSRKGSYPPPTDVGNNEEQPKKKKKKKNVGSKDERRKKREAEALKKIYAPKDSHIQVITPEMLQKMKGMQMQPTSSALSQPRKAATFPFDFPPISSTPIIPKGNSVWGALRPPLRSRKEYPTLGEVVSDISKPSTSYSAALEYESGWETDQCEEETKPNVIKTEVNSESELELSTIPLEDSVENMTESNNQTLNISTPGCSKKKHSKKPIVISINVLLETRKDMIKNTPKLDKKRHDNSRVSNPHRTLGNLLDSSGPALINRGKIRETPKVKKPSKLKRAIMKTRALRKANIATNFSNKSKTSVPENAKDMEHESVSDILCQDIKVEPNSCFSSATSSPAPETQETKDSINCQDMQKDMRESYETVGTAPLEIAEKVKTEIYEDLKENSKTKTTISLEITEKIKTEIDEDVKESCETKVAMSVDGTEKIKTEIDEDVKDSCETKVAISLEGTEKIKTEIDEDVKDSCETKVAISLEGTEKIKTEILEDIQEQYETKGTIPLEVAEKVKTGMHSRRFRSYCDMYISKELHGHVIALMNELHRFQDRIYHSDPMKFKTKRRYVNGLKDVFTFLQINKLTLIIFAPDIEPNNEKGGLDDKLNEIIALAKEKEVPYIFSGNRYILGKPLKHKTPVSVIGILDRQGADDLFRVVLQTAEKLREKYTIEFNERVQRTINEQSVT